MKTFARSSFRSLVLPLLILPIIVGTAHSQWQSIGPEGTTVSTIAILDTVVLCSPWSGNRLERSTDGGHSWSQVVMADSIAAGTFVQTTDRLYMTSNHGLFVSRDRGVSWRSVSSFPNTSVTGLISIPGAMLATGYGSGIFRSTDDGSTWTKLPANDSLVYNSSIYCVGTGPWGALKYTIFVSSSYGTFRSTDIGFSWSRVDIGAGNSYLYPMANVDRLRSILGTLTISTTVYGAGRYGVYVSTDLGTSWRQVGAQMTKEQVFTICPAGAANDTLLAGSQFGVMMLVPGDSVWRYSMNGMPQVMVMDLRRRNALLIAGTSLGTYISSDNGIHWTQSVKGMSAGGVDHLAMSSSALFASSSYSLLRRKNTSGIWEALPLTGQHTGGTTQLLSAGGARLIALNSSNDFRRSMDNGDTWTFEGEAKHVAWYSMAYNSAQSRLYAGTDSGVFVSTNTGTSWSPVGSGFPGDEILLVASQTQGAVSTVFAVSRFIGLNYSENNGASWVRRTTPYRADLDYSGGAWPNVMTFGGGNWFLSTGMSKKGFFRSADFGAHWDTLAAPGTVVNDIAYANSTLLVACTQGLALSKDFGKHWTMADPTKAPFPIYSLAMSGDTVYAATNNGVLMRRLSEISTSVEPNHTPVPATLALAANYPNPFNPSTTIRYEVPRASFVLLAVYDLLGRRVALPVHEVKSAGRYEATFDGSGLSSGVYVYRLEAGGAATQRVMMLLK